MVTGENLARAVALWAMGDVRISQETREHAKVVISDTLAAMLAGVNSDVMPVLLSYCSTKHGTHPVLGSAVKTDAESAALLNGTLAAALEFDDVLSIMPGHPSAVIMAALLAEEAALKANGQKLIEAYCVGIQAGARIAQAMTLDHYKKGFHVTGTIAVFSAVLALCKIRQMSVASTVQAIGISASMASGIQGNFGTMTKPLHSGWAARNAVVAVHLAQAGLTASERIFETDGGFFDAYGSKHSSLQHVDSLLAEPWILDDPGVTLKLFPCCYASHRGIDGVMTLMKRLKIKAADIKKVVVFAPPGGLIPLKFPVPKTHFESLFSLPYAIAVTALDGHPVLRSFSTERVVSADVAEFLKKVDVTENEVTVAGHPNYQEHSYGSRGEVHVEIWTQDGRRDSENIRFAPGHPMRRMTWEQAEKKFIGCSVEAKFTETHSQQAFQKIKHLEAEIEFKNILKQLVH